MVARTLQPQAVAVQPYEQAGPRIKAYIINVDGSTDRMQCMADQLSEVVVEAARRGAKFHFQRFPAVTFSTCHDGPSCMEERPKCFPSRATAVLDHGTGGKDDDMAAGMVRGILGNACSHLKVFEDMQATVDTFDYAMVFEDDCIFSPNFTTALLDFLETYPRHWNLVAVDTLPGLSLPGNPDLDMFRKTTFGELYSISGTHDTYWGAHAWLVNRRYLYRVTNLYSRLPAMPVDWFPKAQRDAHTGMWALRAGIVQQRFLAAGNIAVQSCKGQMMFSDVEGGEDKRITLLRGSVKYRVLHEHSPAWQRRASDNSVRKVVVLGMPEAGARVLLGGIQSYVEQPNQLSVCSRDGNSDNEASCDDVHVETHPMRLIQRASEDAALKERLRERIGVIIVRHPFTWAARIQKLIRKGGAFVQCGNSTGVDMMQSPCDTAPVLKQPVPSEIMDAAADPREFCEPLQMDGKQGTTCWSSLPQAWNTFMQGYHKIRNMGLFHHIVFLRYEDLAEYPMQGMLDIAMEVGLPPGAVQNGQVPIAIRPGTPPLGCQDQVSLCSTIDTATLHELGYHGCQQRWVGMDKLISGDSQGLSLRAVMQEVRAMPEAFHCH